MAMISSGECQWVHWVRGVTERPWTVGVAEDDMVVGRYLGVSALMSAMMSAMMSVGLS
jgi:hypothetical protein